MDPRNARETSLYESGLLTAKEWANSLLSELVCAGDLDPSFVATLDAMPSAVGQEFRTLVTRIADTDFRWAPFFLTTSPPPSDPTRYSAQLRRIWTLLNEGEIHSEAPRVASEAREAIGAAGSGGARSRSPET